MTSVSVACPAKVNLFLRILAREDSGYHQIETLFQAVGLFDRVDVRPSVAGISISVDRSEPAPGAGDMIGDLGDPDDNTVMKAARAFFAATGMEPAVSLALTKRIPAGTGLGGGSSDAAGTLVALNLLAELQRGDSVEMGEVADDFDSQIQEFSSWVRDTIPESRAAQRFLSSAKS